MYIYRYVVIMGTHFPDSVLRISEIWKDGRKALDLLYLAMFLSTRFRAWKVEIVNITERYFLKNYFFSEGPGKKVTYVFKEKNEVFPFMFIGLKCKIYWLSYKQNRS